MGYYTDYSLKIEIPGKKNKHDIIINDLDTITEYSWEEVGDKTYSPGDSIKWYDHDSDLKTMSKMPRYKDAIFTLDGDGEESGDIWRAFYKNGKTYSWQPQMDYPKFDEKLLQ